MGQAISLSKTFVNYCNGGGSDVSIIDKPVVKVAVVCVSTSVVIKALATLMKQLNITISETLKAAKDETFLTGVAAVGALVITYQASRIMIPPDDAPTPPGDQEDQIKQKKYSADTSPVSPHVVTKTSHSFYARLAVLGFTTFTVGAVLLL